MESILSLSWRKPGSDCQDVGVHNMQSSEGVKLCMRILWQVYAIMIFVRRKIANYLMQSEKRVRPCSIPMWRTLFSVFVSGVWRCLLRNQTRGRAILFWRSSERRSKQTWAQKRECGGTEERSVFC